MSITTINNILKQEDLQDNILLIGVEEYNIEQDLKQVLNKFYPNSDTDYNYHTVDAETTPLNSLLDIANSFPMLGDKTTVVCKNFGNYFEGRIKKGDRSISQISEYFNKPNPTTQLILCVSQDKFSKVKNNKFPKPWDSVTNNCDSIFYPKLWPDKFASYISNKFSEHGVRTSDEVIRIILSQTPENLRDIGNQVDKIVTFLADKKELDNTIIYDIIGNSRKYNVFELQKQVILRDLSSALHIVQNIYTNSKTDLVAIASIFQNFFKNVLKYLDVRSKGLGKFDLAREIGISPFFVDDIKQASTRYSERELEKIFIHLSETDLKLKSSGENPLILVNKLLINIMKKVG